MIYLADFSVLKPDPGLFFWTTVIFLLFWLILGKLAFGPIAKALRKRENDIQNSLDEAKKAREDMSKLIAKNEQLLAQAREERSKILKEAKEAKDNIVQEAKVQAKEEARKIVTNAKQEIENQRMAAIIDLKNQFGIIALEIAEKVLRKELKSDANQEKFVNKLVDEIKMN